MILRPSSEGVVAVRSGTGWCAELVGEGLAVATDCSRLYLERGVVPERQDEGSGFGNVGLAVDQDLVAGGGVGRHLQCVHLHGGRRALGSGDLQTG